ncbi:methyltransferase domain-containing protein [Kitasatospora acidiphila]|uniref:Methyltransferase domain-containing protein n=1 Tax=Kitasatospora acidiphila TaxID=2567942 RepID=A0A540W198_9ACTN|nr:methyltransferase domain-containing protein [Kitasatospora acidiphila]TQF02796.1 methyltransferase domain-containing protein [Kitasatospora acidiphila]
MSGPQRENPQPDDPQTLKACCASAYQSDAVTALLGTSLHPGGPALTRHLARTLELAPGMRVLDVASGTGSTALLLAAEFGCEVVGVDLGEQSVARARAAAEQAGLAMGVPPVGGRGRVTFRTGDAEQLPFPDGSFDAVMCECAFCTFPDKPTAALEFARVLRPGGRVGITDVTLAPSNLPPELAELAGWVACLADARPLERYAALLTAAGLHTVRTERHDDALRRMVEQIDARLRALRIAGAAVPGFAEPVDLDRALALTAHAARAVDDGTAGYALLVAQKPQAAQ